MSNTDVLLVNCSKSLGRQQKNPVTKTAVGPDTYVPQLEAKQFANNTDTLNCGHVSPSPLDPN